ncbi:MAG: ABC transporter permease [Deltaproteobacteria bacterium]|nr:ABC transporter permease [Deltaproteobacteria bacterium]MBW2019530.1 ABC transporter permease [Deltaproteobacteria bacterium]MBW2074344.1 ABC transporter permease [Deltaproteobacteria bacterium]
MSSLVQGIGKQTINSLNHLLDLFAFTNRIAGILFKRHKIGRKLFVKITFEQIYFTAIEALPIVLFIALITGSMIIIQLTKQFATVEGKYILGELIVILVVRELGPLFTALVVILRSAVALTVETSYMTVHGEMDALEMQGIDPVYIICLPRLIGITVAILCLFFIFDMVAILGGYGVAWTVTDIPVENFLEEVGRAISGIDITVGLVKALFFGLTITVTSLYRGFRVKKAITKIPPETSKSAIECFLYCLFINIIISVIFYL